MNDKVETEGPRVGIQLTLEGANIVLQRHLNKSCISLDYLDRGYNNKVYIVNAEDGLSYVVRLCGRYWTTSKTEGEVAGILYLSQKCPDIPLPKVLGFCSSRELSGINAEYILMEKLPGKPLDDTWRSMGFEEQARIAKQAARIFVSLKRLRFEELGSFLLPPHISATHGLGINMSQEVDGGQCQVHIGQLMEHQVGPFTNYLDFFRELCGREVLELNRCEFLRPQLENLGRIERFVKAVTDKENTPLSPAVHTNVPVTFHHGDFEARNILVTSDGVSGLLDFEFCGSFPIDNDWFDGVGFLGARTAEWRIFGEAPPADNNDHDSPDPAVIAPIRHLFLKEIDRIDPASLPKNIPGHFERGLLHYFSCNICPWYLREVSDPTPENLKDRAAAAERVEFVLAKYGF